MWFRPPAPQWPRCGSRSRLESSNRASYTHHLMADGYSNFNGRMIEDLRAHEGTATMAPFSGAKLAILHTKGAKSGEMRQNPLAFSQDGDRLVVVASKGGAPDNPDWYHNLVANPEVEVELPPERFRARATPVTDDAEYERLYSQHAKDRPGFLEYRKKTSRRIPVVVLERID